MTDFRALCCQLCGAIATQNSNTLMPAISEAYDRATTALAESDSEPTTYELHHLVDDLIAALDSGADYLREWGNYCEDYYKNKHGFDADLAHLTSAADRARKVLSGKEKMGECDI